MVKPARALCVVLALGWAGATQAQTPPDGLVWMVLRDINAIGFDRDDPMNRPPLVAALPEGMIRAVDISRDRRPDWLIDDEVAGLTPYCGTGGCVKRLYVSTDDGYVRAFDNQALELLAMPNREIEARVHPLYCADEPRSCSYRFGWNAEARRLEPAWNTSARPMGEGAYPAIDPEANGG